jgi:CheY-like chemotaxis protein
MKHENILMIDDDPDDQLYFQIILKEIAPAIQLNICNNGLEGINYLKRAKQLPSLIFLDLNMPIMNGYEFLIELIPHDDFRKIPVIIFTTSTNQKDIDRTKELGAKYFFTKPSDSDIFKKTLKEILDTDFMEQAYYK